MVVSLQDVPKRVQYITVDSQYVKGSNNTFTVDISLESNIHIEEMNKVIGIKMVDFYVTQVGKSDATGNTNVAKYIDVVCPDVPKIAQMLDERKGQIFARVPLERSFTGSNDFIMRDKQWKSFNRQTAYFNPMSIQKLHFNMYESQGDGDYELLQPSVSFYMILEVTTIDVKEKPVNKEVQILEAIHELIGKFANVTVQLINLPDEFTEGFEYLYLLVDWFLLDVYGGHLQDHVKRDGGLEKFVVSVALGLVHVEVELLDGHGVEVGGLSVE